MKQNNKYKEIKCGKFTQFECECGLVYDLEEEAQTCKHGITKDEESEKEVSHEYADFELMQTYIKDLNPNWRNVEKLKDWLEEEKKNFLEEKKEYISCGNVMIDKTRMIDFIKGLSNSDIQRLIIRSYGVEKLKEVIPNEN